MARAALFGDTVLAAAGRPSVEVITAAKTDLQAGQTIDGLGGYMTYGLAENAEVVQAERLLPIGLAEGCTLLRDIPKDGIITYDDVRLPEGRLSDQLRAEQDAMFWGRTGRDDPCVAPALPPRCCCFVPKYLNFPPSHTSTCSSPA